MRNSTKKLDNKIAIVTGASTGIGKAVALAASREGAKVVLVARNQSALEKVANQIAHEGGSSIIMTADLSDQNQIQQLIDRISKAVRRIDILFNIAGVWHSGDKVFYGKRLDEISLHQLNEVVNVNIIAPMLLARSLVKLMLPYNSGKIINLSGTFSKGGAKWLHYYVSKRAVENFTIGLADELREFGIQVNCVSPSDVASPAYVHFYPDDARIALNPNEVAKLALWLALDDTDNISGQIIVIKSKSDPSPLL